jgi:hypothetical protein
MQTDDSFPQQALASIAEAKSQITEAANVTDDGAQVAQTPKSHNDVLTKVVHAALLLLNLFETIFHQASGTPGAGSITSGLAKPPSKSETNTSDQ